MPSVVMAMMMMMMMMMMPAYKCRTNCFILHQALHLQRQLL
jgi:hypothetical protein